MVFSLPSDGGRVRLPVAGRFTALTTRLKNGSTETLGHDVSAVFHLGGLVRHAGHLSEPDPWFQRQPDRLGLCHHGHRGHDLAVLHGAGGRPILRFGESAGGTSPGGWAAALLGVHSGRLQPPLPGVADLHPVLHAHPGSHQLSFLPPHGEPGTGVSPGESAGNHRVDRRGVGGGAACTWRPATCRCRLPRARR